MRRFRQIDATVFGSGKYSAAELKAASIKHGLQVVVDLRDYHRPMLLADSTYDRLGLNYCRVPIDEYRPFTLTDFDRIVTAIDGKVALVHCWKGIHRTGTFEAWWRIRRMGMTLNQARSFVSDGFGTKHPALWQSMEAAC